MSTRHPAPAVLDIAVRDLRYAWRVLRQTPAFSLTAVTVLGVALGVNIAVFAIVNAVLLEPLPYPRPENLALVSRVVTHAGATAASHAVDGRTWELVRDSPEPFGRAVYSSWATGVNLVAARSSGATATYVQQQRVGAGFFHVLGTTPSLGRDFTPDEDRPDGPAVVVLSHQLWRDALGGDREALGRTITLRGQPFTIVGVMPPGFGTGVPADLWTPLRATTGGEGGGENYHVLLRFEPENAKAAAIGAIVRAGEDLRRERGASETHVAFSVVSLQRGMTGALRQPILILSSAVAIVLLAASVNLAGLMLARTSSRTREIATRMALGAGRTAIIRQLLVEALVLGVAGGGLGILVGSAALSGFEWLAGDTYALPQPIVMSWRTIAAAAMLSAFASLIFGLGPAIHASRTHVGSGLASGGSRSIAGSGRHWPRRALVVGQVALGVMLSAGAGLLLRTFTHLEGLDAGFDPKGLVAASVSLEDARYRTADSVRQLLDASIDRMRQSPAVESAAASLGLPYERILNLGFRHVDGSEARADTALRMTSATYVTPRYFEAMRIPLGAGRAFDERDRAGSPPVAIVNGAFVRTYFSGADPIGRRIRISGTDREIVGVAGDVQLKPGWGDNGPLSAMPLTYLPVAQVTDGFLRLVHGWFRPTFVVRSSLAPSETAGAIRMAIAAIDPLLPIASVRTMSEVQSTSLTEQRLLATLLLGLAAAVVAVGAIGLHGLIATSVAERAREIGIRLALGSTIGRAVRSIALSGILLASIGTVLGLAGAALSTPIIRPFVWGVGVNDPMTFATIAGVLFTVAAAASLLPALRILRLDPATILRG